jgi:choline monooxygenase
MNQDNNTDVMEDITRASTLSSKVYTDTKYFELSKEKIFARSFHFIGDNSLIKIPGQVIPIDLLPGVLDEPILFSRDFNDNVHCLSNVCSHRGSIVVENSGIERSLRCRYHGRKFELDGCFVSMPEMNNAKNFPTEKDSLQKIQYFQWKKWIFVSLEPNIVFTKWIEPVEQRVGFLPFEEFTFDSKRSRDYLVDANWALYCDNYLEGFHIPYVHPSLTEVLDYSNYTTELFDYCNLQLGIANGAEETFDLPSGHPDENKNVAAYYFWMWPNLMLNFYPWGLSVNIVQPLAHNKTKISFLSYVWDENKLSHGAGASLDRVEREDEVVVENVFKGLKSRYYKRGRFSPDREQGVHHFHLLLSQFLKQ